jgi:hypothetical protein
MQMQVTWRNHDKLITHFFFAADILRESEITLDAQTVIFYVSRLLYTRLTEMRIGK